MADGGDPSGQSAKATAKANWSATISGWLLAFLVGTIGAIVFVYLNAPLPIFLGALAFSMAASIARLPVRRPMALSDPMRAVLGVAIGGAFTPALLSRAGEIALSLSFIIPFSAFITLAGYYFFTRVAGFSKSTAFFGSVPGGLNDMVSMAEDARADERAVTLLSAVRMVLILFLVPVYMVVADGRDVGGALIETIHIWDVTPIDAVTMLAMAIGGYWLAKRLGIVGAGIVGPMIVSGACHAFGLTTATVPTELLIVSQLTLGILLGAQFRGVTAKDFIGTIVWGLLFSTLLMAASIVVAIGVSSLTGADPTSVLLAFAPGGQAELNLLAIILNLDVAFIALHHLLRVAAVIIGAQIVYRMHPEWQANRHAKSKQPQTPSASTKQE